LGHEASQAFIEERIKFLNVHFDRGLILAISLAFLKQVEELFRSSHLLNELPAW
jgi:hypothetical protein